MVSSTNCIRKPKEVPNPNYFELEKPDFEPIAAISIEIWTVQKMRLQSHESLSMRLRKKTEGRGICLRMSRSNQTHRWCLGLYCGCGGD
ncbi:hypothetical protein V6N13_060952 [Hibiscus sabdariffa]